MRKLRAVDLFCCAGGATRGLQLAGFHVTGIDIKRQPHYVGDAFIQGDALNPPLDLREFDFAWSSPPCQHNQAPIGVYGGHVRDRCRAITVTGHTPQTNVVRNRVRQTFTTEDAQAAMGIDWMPMSKLSQAIPPAYSQFIGEQVIAYLKRKTEETAA